MDEDEVEQHCINGPLRNQWEADLRTAQRRDEEERDSEDWDEELSAVNMLGPYDYPVAWRECLGGFLRTMTLEEWEESVPDSERRPMELKPRGGTYTRPKDMRTTI